MGSDSVEVLKAAVTEAVVGLRVCSWREVLKAVVVVVVVPAMMVADPVMVEILYY